MSELAAQLSPRLDTPGWSKQTPIWGHGIATGVINSFSSQSPQDHHLFFLLFPRKNVTLCSAHRDRREGVSRNVSPREGSASGSGLPSSVSTRFGPEGEPGPRPSRVLDGGEAATVHGHPDSAARAVGMLHRRCCESPLNFRRLCLKLNVEGGRATKGHEELPGVKSKLGQSTEADRNAQLGAMGVMCRIVRQGLGRRTQ